MFLQNETAAFPVGKKQGEPGTHDSWFIPPPKVKQNKVHFFFLRRRCVMVSPTSPLLWLSTPCRRSWPSAPDQAAYGCILSPSLVHSLHPVCGDAAENKMLPVLFKTCSYYSSEDVPNMVFLYTTETCCVTVSPSTTPPSYPSVLNPPPLRQFAWRGFHVARAVR